MNLDVNTNKYEIVIPGEPTAKARPRMTKSGFVYTPKNTANYETLVEQLYFCKYGQTMLEGSLFAQITAYLTIPKSTSRKKISEMISGRLKPIKKPDVDNIAKSILDALNSIAYKDDSQITTLLIKKRYSNEPRVELTLEFDTTED